MSSFVRRMQTRSHNGKIGFKLGVTNEKAPLPNSLGARGSRRGTKNKAQ